MTRFLSVAAFALLAACSGGEGAGNNAAAPEPLPSPTAPPPRTPRMQVPAADGNDTAWLGPRDAATPAPVAPYANTLDGPVVEPARR